MISNGLEISRSRPAAPKSLPPPPPSVGLISDPDLLTQRQALVAAHLNDDGSGENTFTGFTDLSGWQVVQANTATVALAAARATDIGDRIVIWCNWDGPSTYNGPDVTGPQSAGLTANASVDWGYDRPAHSVLLAAGPGYSPEISTGAARLNFIGMHRVELRGLHFTAPVRFYSTSYFPGLAITAIRTCSFSGIPGVNFAIASDGQRVLHVEDCLFDSCFGGMACGAEYFRSWNNTFRNHTENDLHAHRGYGAGWQSGWTAHAWIAGALDYDRNTTYSGTGTHPDFYQIGNTPDGHQGYASLIECNIAHMNGPVDEYPTQGFFGSTGTGFSADWCVHNNILAHSAYWGCVPYDPNDTGEKRVYRNIFARSAGGQDADSFQRIKGARRQSGTGSLTVSENYFAENTGDLGYAANETWVGNIDLDFRQTAALASRPQTLLTGNNSWTSNPYGWTAYQSPDAGAGSAASARAALAGFFMPKGGWRTAGCGPVDPALWPAGGAATL